MYSQCLRDNLVAIQIIILVMEQLELVECKDSVLNVKVLVLSPSQIRQREEKAQREIQEKENEELRNKRLKKAIITLCVVLGIIWVVVLLYIMLNDIGYTDFFGYYTSGLLSFLAAGVLGAIGYGIYLLYEKHL